MHGLKLSFLQAMNYYNLSVIPKTWESDIFLSQGLKVGHGNCGRLVAELNLNLLESFMR